MRRTAVKTVTDFAFQSDFSTPDTHQTEAVDTVAVTAGELAELLANARKEGAESATMKIISEQQERLGTLSEQLKTALKDLLTLAEHLDRSALSKPAQTEAQALLAAACAHIVNAQRDLFVDQ